MVNFLPYPKGNRDEWISVSEMDHRLSGLYMNVPQETDSEVINKNLSNLREYASKFIKPKEPRHKADNKDKSKVLPKTQYQPKQEEKKPDLKQKTAQTTQLKPKEPVPVKKTPQTQQSDKVVKQVNHAKKTDSKGADEVAVGAGSQQTTPDTAKTGNAPGFGGMMMGSLPPLGGANLANNISSMKLGQRGQFGQPMASGTGSGSGMFSGPNPFQNLSSQFNQIQDQQPKMVPPQQDK